MTIIYYLILLLALIVRFGDLPNYIKFYDWWGNIQRIIVSTPSLKDTFLILKDEWIMEIGFMNYDFGAGISEWSLFFAPIKILGVFVLSFFLVLNYFLLKKAKSYCSPAYLRSAKATTGLGAGFVALASVTMSWVVCCSYPTWVVGLAMMGLGVSTALWLEPLGFSVSFIGFFILFISTIISAGGVKPSMQVKSSM
jgi:hypothetical protein